jgi:hypothetical protein
MARRADDLVSDPAVVVISRPALAVDEWLESLRWPEPLDLRVSGAELVAEARADEE